MQNLSKIKVLSRKFYYELEELITTLENSSEQESIELLRAAELFWTQDNDTLFHQLEQRNDATKSLSRGMSYS